MFAEKHYPEILRPEELDNYLARGWYRMGQTIFTTHFLCFDEKFYSAIWVRLPLKDYTFRKSLKRLLNRNSRLFRTEIKKASLSNEKEHLYYRYKSQFTGALAPNLKDSLLDGEDFTIYDTYEISVYDKDRLIAVSFFDRGRQSVASIMGIFDPDYRKYSLGFYTMLLEIASSQDNQIPFYYPGYVVPGYPRFDYKLRIGEVSYYDLRTKDWIPYKQLKPKDIPIFKMERKLGEMQTTLKKSGIPNRKLYYPLFEANLFGFWRAPYLDYPVFLLCFPERSQNHYLMITYDVRDESYQILRCSPFDDLQFYFNEAYTNSFDQDRYFMELVVVDLALANSPHSEKLALALQDRRSRPSAGG